MFDEHKQLRRILAYMEAKEPIDRNFIFCRLSTADRTPVQKTFSLDNGRLKKKSEAHHSAFDVEPIPCTLQEIPQILDSLEPYQAITTGIARRGRTRPKAQGEFSRTKEHFTYQKKPGLFLLDVDDAGMPVDEFLGILGSLHPLLASCTKIIRHSSSAGIYRDGDLLTTLNKYHVYLPVDDLSKSPDLMTAIYKKLWLAGHGGIVLNAAGAPLDRSLVDRAVASPERLVFETAPALHDGLERRVPETRVIEGDILNAEGVVISDDEIRESDQMIADAKEKHRNTPEAKKTRSEYLKRHTKKFQKKGFSRADAENIVKSRMMGLLSLDDVVQTDDGPITIKRLIEEGKQRYIADPLEPWKGSQKASFTPARGDDPAYIYSWLKGGQIYRIDQDGIGTGLFCPETAAKFWELKKLTAQREEGVRRQCPKFALLLIEQELYKIGRSLPDLITYAGQYCSPTRELMKAAERLLERRKEIALSTLSFTADYHAERDSNDRLNHTEICQYIIASPDKGAGVHMPCGCGKTQGIAEFLASFYGTSVFLYHFAALAKATSKKVTGNGEINLDSYDEIHGWVPHLSTCINSLRRFAETRPKLVIIDEAKQLLFSFKNNTTWTARQRKEAIKLLQEIVHHAEKVIFLDADLDDKTLKGWEGMLKIKCATFSGQESSRKRYADLVYSVKKGDSQKQATHAILAAWRRGEKVIAAIESQKALMAMQTDLEAEGVTVISMHGDTPAAEIDAFTDDPDKYIATHKPDVLLHTSKIGTGVSIEGKYFTLGVLLWDGSALTAEEAMQNLCRDRYLTQYKLFVSQRGKGRWTREIFAGIDTEDFDPDNLDPFLESLAHHEIHCQTYAEDMLEHLLEKRNFVVNTRTDTPLTTITPTKEIRQALAKGIAQAEPRDVMRLDDTDDHYKKRAFEIRGLLGISAPDYRVPYETALEYVTDPAKFKRTVIAKGVYKLDSDYQSQQNTLTGICQRLEAGIVTDELAGVFDELKAIKTFLTIFGLVDPRWVDSKGKDWPKRKFGQAIVNWMKWIGVNLKKPQKGPPPKQREMARLVEMVAALKADEPGIGYTRIAARLGITVKQARKVVAEWKYALSGSYPGISNTNKNGIDTKKGIVAVKHQSPAHSALNTPNDTLAPSHQKQSFPVSERTLTPTKAAPETPKPQLVHVSVTETLSLSDILIETKPQQSQFERVLRVQTYPATIVFATTAREWPLAAGDIRALRRTIPRVPTNVRSPQPIWPGWLDKRKKHGKRPASLFPELPLVGKPPRANKAWASDLSRDLKLQNQPTAAEFAPAKSGQADSMG